MDMNDLTAIELARLDAICLDYECALRAGNASSIDSVVEKQGGKYADLLRSELIAVRDEIAHAASAAQETTFSTFATPSVPADTKSSLAMGDQIGPYVLTNVLGQGGMGIVYQAMDMRLNRKVAIKMLAVERVSRDPQQLASLRERFEREARAVAALSHPNIVELFDVGISDSNPFAVMELLDGETLDLYLAKTNCDAETVRKIGAQVADALAVAHRSGVVHRDLKPQNIMVMRRKDDSLHSPVDSSDAAPHQTVMVKLFDFGLSRSAGVMFDNAVGGDKPHSDAQTREGVVMGTPGYMAPEQARGEVAGPAADIFALGCILFEAFYGKRAFDGATPTARYASTLEAVPDTDPVVRRSDLALADLISECLHKEIVKRPASAEEIALRLRQRGPMLNPIQQQSAAGYGAGVFVRRRFMELLAGGSLGGLAVGLAFPDPTESLRGINSLAVLSFTDTKGESTTLAVNAAGLPLGDQVVDRGDELAALLVNELSRLKDVNVTPFRPLVATKPEQFRHIGAELEVDALVTGSFKTIQIGQKSFDEIRLQIVSSRTGNQLWGQNFLSPSGESLLEQSRFASELATAVGRSLTSSDEELAPPHMGAFSCLVDGVSRADPDSPAGMRKALSCFQSARRQDKGYTAPIAGIALTSITLAGQSPSSESLELIQAARNSVSDALALDKKSIDARLANAMLLWQTLYRYDEAAAELDKLLIDAPNHWQVRHQYGLLELTRGNAENALRLLREATQLNPMSVIAKVDHARSYWFLGNIERAIVDAKRAQAREPENPHPRGLLIDIYEYRGQFDLAAAEHIDIEFGTRVTPETYFEKRRASVLEQHPYGPFGTLLNQAILDSRITGHVGDATLGELADATPPMLPLLLSGHPSFASARLLPRAAEILPERSVAIDSPWLGTRTIAARG
ncbi:Serine/threonine-protein kinase PknA [Novipirellula galeiformis]|uniref:Serine/threonine-protein kinase PknA n=1 Tax=Novipirellula galeiformis TaxID=2528004 RepID=A0A5C6CC79_9BACT|nr:serine/threonine-protein kinase [Novipirellula galeiformis]TWU21044.1 Serine/threonine-protein kinase PknA [Novipirellula galeiformis]